MNGRARLGAGQLLVGPCPQPLASSPSKVFRLLQVTSLQFFEFLDPKSVEGVVKFASTIYLELRALKFSNITEQNTAQPIR